MSRVKHHSEQLRQAGLKCVESVEALVEAVDRDNPVGASLTLETNGDGYVFAAVSADGSMVYMPGAGDYAPSLKRLANTRLGLNIGIRAAGKWPPCPDFPLCIPDVTARQQHFLNEILATVRKTPEKP